MAAKTIVTLEDDLDGTPADETLRFALGPAAYEIDLSAANASKFRAQLAPFIEHARKHGRGQRSQAGRSPAARRKSDRARQVEQNSRYVATVTNQ